MATIAWHGLQWLLLIPAVGGSLSLTMPAGYVTVTEVTKPGYAVWSGCLGSAYGFALDAQANGISLMYTNTQMTYADGELGAQCEFVNVAPFSLTVIKDAIPDSSQPFTISVNTGVGVQELDIPLVDDGTALSNTAVITGVEADHVAPPLDKRSPPELLDVVFQLDAERSVVPGVGEAAVDVGAGEHESPAFGQRDDLLHRRAVRAGEAVPEVERDGFRGGPLRIARASAERQRKREHGGQAHCC
mgnify:CR=1 FL=1